MKDIIKAYHICKQWRIAKYFGKFNLTYEDYDRIIARERKYLLRLILKQSMNERLQA